MYKNKTDNDFKEVNAEKASPLKWNEADVNLPDTL